MSFLPLSSGGVSTPDYVGNELELFQHAHNWKAYMRSALACHIAGDIADVGAGIGANMQNLATLDTATHWTAIEPDTAQCAKVAELVRNNDALKGKVDVYNGTLPDLPDGQKFDTIIYIDVLEHIEADIAEVGLAENALKPGGRIVVLAPAYQYLFGEFDRSVGHFRRYTRAALRELAKPYKLTEIDSFYLDCIGLMTSLANKWVLHQDLPTSSQIGVWDRLIVPVSKFLDPVVRRSFGRSVVIVWQKPL